MEKKSDDQLLQLSIFLFIHRDIGYLDIEAHFTYDMYTMQYNITEVYPGYELNSEITYLLHLIVTSLSELIDYDKGYICIEDNGYVSLYGKFGYDVYEDSKLLITKQHIKEIWKKEAFLWH